MGYLYLSTIIILLLLSLLLNNFNIVAPQMVFCFGFFFQAIWVVIYNRLWELDILDATYEVILLGILTFFIVTSIIRIAYNNPDKTRANLSYGKEVTINIPTGREAVYLVVEVIIAAFYLKLIVDAVGGSLTSFESISSAIGEFDRLSKFTDSYNTVRIPSLFNNIKAFTIASGYWFAYVVIKNYFAAKRISLLEIAIIGVSALISIMSGSRTPLFMLLIAVITYVIILMRSNSRLDNAYIKMIGKIAIVGTAFVITFIAFGTLLGRNIERNPLDYLFIYCGAEVKNLDLFIREMSTYNRNDIWGSQTFFSLVKTYGEKIGFEGYKTYSLDLPFRGHLGNGLGNVYTTFYPYLYDFGYKGVIILSAMMGLISQYIFEQSLINQRKNIKSPDVMTMCYGIICGCLLLSFFSNKFYENVFSMGFIKNIVFWIVMNVVFTSEVRIKEVVFRFA